MATIHKHSAGGIIYSDGLVLTINWRTKSSIEFPKGGFEPGESAENTALREVEEETGYHAQIVAPLGAVEFDYDSDGQAYTKKVDYFLMEIKSGQIDSPRPHREAGEDFDNLWLTVRQANRRLTYDDGRLILQRAVDIIKLLGDDNRQSVAYVKQVVRRMTDHPDFVPIVIGCMLNRHRGLAMRAADSVEKYSRVHSEALRPFAADLINVMKKQPQKEVRWHLAQILPRLNLTDDQSRTALKVWTDDFYHATSDIVRTMSLQAVHDIAKSYAPARKKLNQLLDDALESGGAAVRARARHLR